MKLSIHVVTYNDEKNIARALQSAIDQKLSCEFEIVIGDDCSTDGTREILTAFRDQHPGVIRLILRERNIGDKGKQNFVNTLQACRGEYVALLPGDDYWTAPDKLQKQIDFLDANAEFSACFHNVLEVDESNPNHARLMCPPDQKTELTVADFLECNHIPTCSVMFRNNLFGEIPEWFYRGLPGDWFLHILNAQHGNVRYLNEVMAVYRKQPGGAWSSMAAEQRVRHVLDSYPLLDAHLNFEYHDACSRHMRDLKRELSYIHIGRFHTIARAGYLGKALPSLVSAIKYEPARIADPRQLAYILKSCGLAAVRFVRGRDTREVASS